MTSNNNYFTKKEFREFYEDKDFLNLDLKLMTTDTYSDSEIMKTIKKNKKRKRTI